MLNKYKTVGGYAEAITIEKKSRFIATVFPVKTEADAQEAIIKLKKKYHDANHNCYAYRVGTDRETSRFSDDGEPGGTAGMPMLDLLHGQQLHNIVVVVTRYFGGTLLGTGGLVRAYTHAAKEGILAAGVVEKCLYSVVHIKSDYGLSGKIQYETLQSGHFIAQTIYTSDVEYIVFVEQTAENSFIKHITEITNASAEIFTEKQCFGTKIENNIVLDEEQILIN